MTSPGRSGEDVLRVFRMRQDVPLPRYATSGAAGLDLSAALPQGAESDPIIIEPGGTVRVPTGLRMILPRGHEGQVRPRSGLAAKHAVTVLNAPGTIDEDYRGEVQVILINHGREAFEVTHGMRVAQLIVAPVTQVAIAELTSEAQLTETDRGSGGFGSTGA